MKIKTPDVNKDLPKTTTVKPEMCECGRLYKDRISHLGKMMCSACYTGLCVDDLAKLWGTPIKDRNDSKLK